MRHNAIAKTPAPQLLVIQPDPSGPLDRFAGWLEKAGLEVRVVRPYAREALPRHLTHDGLMVLGGDMSANDDEVYPWLIEIRRLLREAAELARPTLGVCLGGQLLAKAMGGSIVPGSKGIEAGVVRVQWTAEADSDALMGDLPQPFCSGSMHGDTIDRLPGGAVWLGQSELYANQAFRVGAQAWGIQFHPEASLNSYRQWVSEFQGSDPLDIRRVHDGLDDFQRSADDVLRGTSELIRRFADLVSTAAQLRHRSILSPESAAAIPPALGNGADGEMGMPCSGA